MSRVLVVAAATLSTLALPVASIASNPGDLDTTFNSPNGFKTVDIKTGPTNTNTCDNSATHLLVQGDGKIVLAGAATSCTPNDVERMVAVRLTATGTLDSGFGTSGKVAVDGITTRTDDGYFDGRLAFDPTSGNIYLYNGSQVPGGSSIGWVTARLDSSNGALDAGWDADGLKDVSTSGGPGDIGVQSDGKVVVLDDFFNTAPTPDNQDMRVCRYTDAGALDGTFGSGGCRTVSFDIGGTDNDFARVMKILPDDRILIGGRAESSSTAGDFAVGLLTAGGDLDAGFGGGSGTVTLSFGLAIGGVDEVRALDQDDQGRFYAGGAAGKGELAGVPPDDCALARLLPNGDPDPAFGGGDGRVNFDYSGGSANSWEQIFGLVVQGDGRVLVAGRGATGSNTSKRAGVARLDASGNLDPTFAGDGATIYNFSSAATPVTVGRSMALQPNGFIVISGLEKDVDNNFFAARIYNDYIFAGGFERGDFSGWGLTQP